MTSNDTTPETDTAAELEPVKAEVTSFIIRGTKTRRHRAWCDMHEDGYQGGKTGATSWANKHNAAEHPEAAE